MDKEHKKNSSFLFSKEDVKKILAQGASAGKNMLEPLKHIAENMHLPFNIIELTDHTNKVEVHKYLNDIWFCLEGEVTFLCGGIMKDPHVRIRSDGTRDETEMRAKNLEGAKEIIMKMGDWLWIPADEPHQHITQGTARLMIIKIPCR